jgi:bacillithiol biosynthesis deacetylase BshB1
MTEPLDVLAVFAHPDDAELLCGGSLIKAADDGARVGALDLTRGETGSRGTPELRAAEAAKAAEIMGMVVRENAGLPDSQLANSHAARSEVARWIRMFRPRVVVTHWIRSRHPDHRAAAALAYDASFLAGLKNFDSEGHAHRPEKVVHATAFREDAPEPTFVVDVTLQVDRRMEAIRAYASQFEGNLAAGEVLPGGSRGLEDQIRAQLAHYGSRIRRSYGEPFWTRETVEAPGLESLGVSTF